MEIDYKSAKIIVDIKDSKVGTDISKDRKWAALHLTRNAGPIIAGDKTASDVDISAINIHASVDVHLSPSDHLSPGDNIPNLKFRYIQLVADMNGYASWAGRTSNDGFMAINTAAPPAVPKEFAYDYVLDSAPEIFGPAVMPFTNPREQVVFPKVTPKGHLVPGMSTIVIEMDVHPSRRVKLAFTNKKTNKPNFLAEMINERYFITAFVVRDEPSKKITPLAYVTWKTIWSAKYHWVQGNCLPYPIEGTFAADKPITGPLKDGEGMLLRTASSLTLKIASPTTDPSKTGNTLMRAASAALDNHPPWWNLDYLEQWPASFPSLNFWKDQ